MYAIVKTSGKQYRVAAGETIRVDRMQAEVGSTVTLDQVLLVGGDSLKIGTPNVEGATITAKVIEHPRGDKVLTFKYRPTRRYRRRVGYRHSHTTLEIVSIDS